MIKDSYYKKNAKNATCVENEIEVMSSLDHVNIVKMIDHGSEGNILKKSGKGLVDIRYIMMEHVKGKLLFDFCESMGSMGEDAGRFFLN